ncbi:MAG: arsenite efflux transporter metallochaperone ArsD [Azospirillaceae bacterium]|nr:arsenite efflux transporter metallochaperone ArsD [Azospirillaceae bacterium]
MKETDMKKLEVFDPALCCSTGVCGPAIDPVLAAFAADLKWLMAHGVIVQRYNLGQEPQAFAANPAIVKEMEAGMDRLPILAVDGHIVSTGIYLSRAQLAQKLGLDPTGNAGMTPSCGSSTSRCC